MERAADQAHKPVPFKKPEKKLKPKSEAEPDEERVEVQEPAETQQVEDTTDTTAETPDAEEPASFKDWLTTRVKKLVECEETDQSVTCWAELENGTACQWSISMEDYPTVEASFKLGSDTVYLDDVTAGRIAREYYTKQREYDPKPWAECVLKVGAEFPDFMRRMEKKAINRATDQDRELSKILAAEFTTPTDINESFANQYALIRIGLMDPNDLDLITMHTEHQNKGQNRHYGLDAESWFVLKKRAAEMGIVTVSGFATSEVYGITWEGPHDAIESFMEVLKTLPDPPIKEWFGQNRTLNNNASYWSEIEKYYNKNR